MAQSAMVAVTGPTIPYIFDLPHILSLPSGVEARFRYFVDLVDPALRASVDEDPHGTRYAGRDLILVYHSQHSERLLPVRKGQVLELRRYGPMCYLRFAVTEFPPVDPELVTGPDRESVREEERKRLHNIGIQAVSAQGLDLSIGLADGTYLRESSVTWKEVTEGSPKQAEPQSDRRWAAIASLLMYEPGLRGVPLFYLEGLLDRRGNRLEPHEMKNHFSKGEESGSGYRPVQHTRYRLRVLQWRASPPTVSDTSHSTTPEMATDHASSSSHSAAGKRQDLSRPSAGEVAVEAAKPTTNTLYRVICRVDPQVLHMEGQSDLVVGKYDVLEYSLKAVGRGYSEMELVVEESGSDAASYPASPQVYRVRVPIKVRWNKSRLAAMVAVFVLGVALYAVTEVPATADRFTGTGAALVQLLALALVYVASADFISGYMKFATQSAKLAPGGVGRGES